MTAPASRAARPRRHPQLSALLFLLVVGPFGCSGFVPGSGPDLSSRTAPPLSRYAAPAQPPPLRSSPADDDDGNNGDGRRTPLNVAIVGAGPSGLLLAHRLLSSPHLSATVTLYEQRPDPREQSSTPGDDRAYALGLGPRARFAIRSVDPGLWEEVLARGYECDRFTLHVTPRIRLRLRDGVKKLPRSFEGRYAADEKPEPSVLIYQTDLCAALVNGLLKRHGGGREEGGRLSVNYGTRVTGANAIDGTVTVQTERGGPQAVMGPYDFVAGCGGVSSPVRGAIMSAAPAGTFTAETRTLPGEFKVARLPRMPPLLDPTSVALILPGGGRGKKRNEENRGEGAKGKVGGSKLSAMSAFVEPVAGGGACVLFASRGGGDADTGGDESENGNKSLLSDRRKDIVDEREIAQEVENILERFPLFDGIPTRDLTSMVKQVLSQRPAVASSVKCNAFHFGRAALCGDAAHATGGVSGQGVNSALIDAAVLAECIEGQLAGVVEQGGNVEDALRSALLSYSQRQVPEGLALYELSFGPEGDLGLLGRVRVILSTLRDTVFGGRFGVGRPLLQVQLSSSLRPFADIRRDRTEYYGVPFPDQETFNRTLAELYDSD